MASGVTSGSSPVAGGGPGAIPANLAGAPALPRSAAPPEIAPSREQFSRLPVSGIGAVAGAANSVATQVARSVADDIAESARSSSGGSSGSSGGSVEMVTRTFVAPSSGGGVVQRTPDGQSSRRSGGDNEGAHDEETQREAWLKFTASDAFRDQVLEMLQERLLAELERRGGRHGGWFA